MLLDFLFPKSEEVYSLEELSAAELVRELEPARETRENVVAIFNYADPRVRQSIWELKYRKNAKIAATFAGIVLDVLRTELAERALFDNFVSPLLIPIPQSHKRHLERGWNQTEVLAEEVLKLVSEPLFDYAPRALTKAHHTESQARTKNKKLRLQNIENSMSVVDGSKIKNRNIILLDDVTTTGATFAEARRALREAGAKKILAIAIAH